MVKSRNPRRWTLTDIVDEARVQRAVEAGRHAGPAEVRALVRKALTLKGLTPEETAVLLQQDRRPDLVREIMRAAGRIKEAIYGKRIVFFAPLYITNRCSNNCLYCAYRRDNRGLVRRSLDPRAIARQVEALEDQGHKRVLLVAGETPRFGDVLAALRTIYATRKAQGEIRRVNVNIAPPTTAQFRRLKAVGIGTYQCFQETYHRETYRRMHPDGPKADYAWRLTVMDRAYRGGVDDVSVGVLLGLYDYRFDVTAMLMHGQYLDRRYGVGPHAVSVPRLRVAHGTPLCEDDALEGNRWRLNDVQFKLVVAVIRLALPYAGLIVTTRERPEMRRELFDAGISQISAGSHTDVGGYGGRTPPRSGQFEIEDSRPLDVVVRDVIAAGNIPSFCTACYRCGRTGETIMDLLKPGAIQKFCLPNALLTFEEYLLDYAGPATVRAGRRLLERQLHALPAATRRRTVVKLDRLRRGERDLFF
jgi:2-iminoacetate synthase